MVIVTAQILVIAKVLIQPDELRGWLRRGMAKTYHPTEHKMFKNYFVLILGNRK